jgi:hypothetical protein
MSFHRSKILWVALLSVFLAGTASATTYVEVLAPSQTQGGNSTLTIQRMAVCEGTTTYHFLAKTSSPADLAMTKVTGVGSSPVTSTLTTLASWTADIGAPSNNRVFTGFGMAIVGDSIQIVDTENDSVFRVDKNTGTVSVYAAKSAIQSFVGGTPDVQNWNGVSPTGEAVFYEGFSKSILQTNGAGVVTTLVSAAQLTGAQGATNTSINSGITYDGAGNVYWGENNSDKVYKRAPDGTITAVLGPTELTPLIGSNISFTGDMFYAPNGWIYMRAGTSTYQSVLKFDPSNPAGTVQTFLSNADLLGGPAASASILGMSWYNGNLGFTTTTTAYYAAIPEPATLALLGLGGLLVARRRRA